MFINGAWAWMILYRISPLAKGTLCTNFGSHSVYFQFLSALFWGKFETYLLLVINELSTKRYLLRQCFSLWQSSCVPIKRVERVKQLSRPSHIPSIFVPCSAVNKPINTCTVWMLPVKWQYATIYHVTGCFIAFQPLHLFCWVTVPSLCAWESYRTSHYSAGKWNRWFYSPKLPIWGNLGTPQRWIMSCQQ